MKINSSFFSKLFCKYMIRFSEKYMNYNSTVLNNYIEKFFFTNLLNQYPVIKIEWNNQIIYQNKSMNLDLESYMKRDICYIFEKKNPIIIIIFQEEIFQKCHQ